MRVAAVAIRAKNRSVRHLIPHRSAMMVTATGMLLKTVHRMAHHHSVQAIASRHAGPDIQVTVHHTGKEAERVLVKDFRPACRSNMR